MKMLISSVGYKDVDIELPLFSYLQDEDTDIYVMIDEDLFRKISFSLDGKVEIIKFKSNNCLSSVWYNNQTTMGNYEDAVKRAVEYINNF